MMPSLDWCNISELVVGEAKSLAKTLNESNVLENILKDATNKIEVPVIFQNCIGLNHRSRSEELNS